MEGPVRGDGGTEGFRVNCAGCGAAMRLDERRACLECPFCGRIHFPEPNADGVQELGEPAGMGCPVCGEALLHAAVAGQRLIRCPRCRGLLIPMPVFSTLVSELRSRRGDQEVIPTQSVERGEFERNLRCPRCGRTMDTHPYYGCGGVVIDNCPDCLWNWLDHGELKRIAAVGPLPAALEPTAPSVEEEEPVGILDRLLRDFSSS